VVVVAVDVVVMVVVVVVALARAYTAKIVPLTRSCMHQHTPPRFHRSPS
jgi:hypothetical protein